MGNKTSYAINHPKYARNFEKSSEEKYKNNLKYEYEYNVNETMVEASPEVKARHDPRNWVPSQLSPSKTMLLLSNPNYFSWPESTGALPQAFALENGNLCVSSKSFKTPNDCELEIQAKTYNDTLIMTPFSFRRSRGSTRSHLHQHQPDSVGSDTNPDLSCKSFVTSYSSNSSKGNKLLSDLKTASESSKTANKTTVPQSRKNTRPEKGDPVLQDSNVIQPKTSNEYKSAWMPEVKRSAAQTNLSISIHKSSKSIFQESKSKTLCTTPVLKTKITKLSFGEKLKKSILRSGFKIRSQSTICSSAVTNPSKTNHGDGSRINSTKDRKERPFKSMDNVVNPVPKSYESVFPPVSGDTPETPILIHKLPTNRKNSDDCSVYKASSHFSSVGINSDSTVRRGFPPPPNTPKKPTDPVVISVKNPNVAKLAKNAKGTGSSESKSNNTDKSGSGGKGKSKGKNKNLEKVSIGEFDQLSSDSGGSNPGTAKKKPWLDGSNRAALRKGKIGYGKRPPPPPVFIGNYGGGSCTAKKCQNPADRLKNVDIVEELVYNCPECPCPTGDCCCVPGCDYYSCCNDCGECQPVCQPCGNCCCAGPCCCGAKTNPVKYCRRQRFNFDDDRRNQDPCDGPPWNVIPTFGKNPYDDIPVGRNPTIHNTSEKDCDVLPCESGTYFYDAERRCFAKVIEVKNPETPQQEIIDEIIDEEPILTNIEPIIQPVIRPDRCGGATHPNIPTIVAPAAVAESPLSGSASYSEKSSPSSSGSKNTEPSNRSTTTGSTKIVAYHTGATATRQSGAVISRPSRGPASVHAPAHAHAAAPAPAPAYAYASAPAHAPAPGMDYKTNLGLMGLCGLNMPGLTSMGPYGALTAPQYQYSAPPIKPQLPEHPVRPAPPHPAMAPYAPVPPGQPIGGSCFPGFFPGPGCGDQSAKGQSRKANKEKRKKDKSSYPNDSTSY